MTTVTESLFCNTINVRSFLASAKNTFRKVQDITHAFVKHFAFAFLAIYYASQTRVKHIIPIIIFGC